MDRREFLRASAATAIGLVLGEHFISAEELSSRGMELIGSEGLGKRTGRKAKKSAYNIVMLGDTHFDKGPDSAYHVGYHIADKTREANHLTESAAYAEMWQDRMPRLLKRAACLTDNETVIALQLGDIAQGDSGNHEEHVQMISDAYERESSEFAPLPFITVVGNHDVRGTSDDVAREAYIEYMCARMTDATGKTVDKTTFGYWIGPDAYIVIDFNKPDDQTLDNLLEETKDARYTFIVVHGPVFPYDHAAYYSWIFHGRRSGATEETRLKYNAILAKRKAIVLCGHTHSTEFLDWYGDGGRITQLTMSSVWKTAKLNSWNIQCEGAENYGSIAEKQATKAGKVLPEASKALFDMYRPGIKSYLHSNTVGSYKMNVGPKGITVDFYAGDDTRSCYTFTLR